MSKQQQESIDMYRKGKREDLVEKETKTQQLIDAMLPKVSLNWLGWRADVCMYNGQVLPVDLFVCVRVRHEPCWTMNPAGTDGAAAPA